MWARGGSRHSRRLPSALTGLPYPRGGARSPDIPVTRAHPHRDCARACQPPRCARRARVSRGFCSVSASACVPRESVGEPSRFIWRRRHRPFRFEMAFRHHHRLEMLTLSFALAAANAASEAAGDCQALGAPRSADSFVFELLHGVCFRKMMVPCMRLFWR